MFLCHTHGTGTFAVIATMAGEGIDHVLRAKGLDWCREDANAHVTISNGSNVTCGEMEAEVAISLAFTSGIIMVGVVNREGVVNRREWVH